MAMTTQQKTEMMGTEKVWKVLLIMAIPGVLGQLSHVLYNFADRYFMGNYVGQSALGAISLTTPLISIMAGLSMLITIGGATLLSMNLGRGKLEEARVLFSNLIIQAIVTSFVLAVVYFVFAPQIIIFSGAPKTSSLYDGGVLYLRIIAFGLMFQLLNAVQASIIRAEGNVKYSLVVSVVGAVINIFLDAFFVVYLKMGIAGAAYATSISQFISAAISTVYFFSGRSRMKWMGFKVLDIKLNLEVIKMGMAPAVLQGLTFCTGILINNSLRIYGDLSSIGGDLAISAMSVIATIESVFSCVVMGINQAVTPICSFNYGAGNMKRVKQASILSVTTASVIAAMAWVAMIIFPEPLFAIFGNDVELIEYGVHAIRLNRIFVVCAGVQSVSGMFFSSIGRPKIATLMSALKQGIFLIPCLWILPQFMGLDGVLLSTAVSDILSTSIIVIVYIKGLQIFLKE